MKKSLGAQTLLLPTPVMVVGTYNEDGTPNIAVAAWGGLVSQNPPALGVSMRQVTKTYHNIMREQAFTVALVNPSTMARADSVGLLSGKDINKFEHLGLKHVKAEKVNAPYADEFPLVLECKLLGDVPISLHVQLIGQIMDVKAEISTTIGAGKFQTVDIKKINPLIFDPAMYNYHLVGPVAGKAFNVGKKFVPKK